MNVVQAWLLVGIPALALGVACFAVRRAWASALGYLVLLGGFAGLAFLHRTSGAVFGGLLALLYAAGRGGRAEGGTREANRVGVPDEALHPVRRRGLTDA